MARKTRLAILMALAIAFPPAIPFSPPLVAQEANPLSNSPSNPSSNPAPSNPAPSPAVNDAAPGAEKVPARPENPEPQYKDPDKAPASLVPTLSPTAPGQYILEFNRSPIVGTRLRMEGIYDEARIRFTRPRNWQPKAIKVLLKYRHSGALYASRSNITVMINGTSVGSVPMNQPQGKIGSVDFTIPTYLVQDYNEVTIAALQNNSPTCTQDPYDPSLWSEIMPDSKLVFDFVPQPVSLDFSRYPYPLFDVLSLESNQIAYVQPKTMDDAWLAQLGRFNASLGRIADYRAMDSRLIPTLGSVKPTDRLVILGTPEHQPTIASLPLPLKLNGQKFFKDDQAIATDAGILLWTTTADRKNPVLVITGNSDAGVAKAMQFLVQAKEQTMATGTVMVIDQVTPVAAPNLRDWPGFLPIQDQFKLRDLRARATRESYRDITIRGSSSPALELDFKARPDDEFLPGNWVTVYYSHGPQINPLTSLLEVELDGVAVAGKRLTNVEGVKRDSFNVELPNDRIRPDSKLQINFRLDPRERRSCSRVTDAQLWGTIHADTEFKLRRENAVKLPDLKLLQFGYPFAAPQDFSNTTIAVPDDPSEQDLQLLLELTERLGRLSRSESLQVEVFRAKQLPQDRRNQRHLIGIGTRDRFPFPEAFKPENFALNEKSARHWRESKIYTAPDPDGLIQQIISPWNRDRVLLILSAQTNTGLDHIKDFLQRDFLFFQLTGDTVLISANPDTRSPFDPNSYSLEFLNQASQTEVRGVDSVNWERLLRYNWFIITPALLLGALTLYGIGQLYLHKIIASKMVKKEQHNDKKF
jgi:cellulose synthase operon protein B